MHAPPVPDPRSAARAAARAPLSDLDTGSRSDVIPGEPGFPLWVASNNVFDNVNNFTNPDNAYLSADLYPAADELAVIRIRVPSFPDTDAGQSVSTTGRQVRYWSICEYYSTNVLSACIHDADAVTVNGDATFVISSTQPAGATAAAGINWLPLGSGPGNGLPALDDVVYRQMLASPSFTQSIAAVRSPLAILTMLSYYPAAAYCTVAVFQQEGATGCLR